MSSSFFSKKEHVLPCQHIRSFPRSTRTTQEEVLHMVINQYTPLDNKRARPGDITIVAAHANGVGKELYEPLWDELLQYSKISGHFGIRGIWIADVSFQGASGVLNEGKLGNDPSWSDHARDLLSMINHFRAEMPPPLVGIGHSMGGQNIVDLSLIHPRLFPAVVLIDPVMVRTSPTDATGHGPAAASTFRRDVWPSRAAASASFLRSPFYQSWDPRVFDLWLTHGLRDLPTPLHPTYPAPSSKDVGAAPTLTLLAAGAASTTAAAVPPSASAAPADTPVTLTTTKHQEVLSFLRPDFPSSRSGPVASASSLFTRPEVNSTFARLPHLRPHCLYVFAEGSDMSGGAPRLMRDKLEVTGAGEGGSGGVAKGAVASVVLGGGAGHFAPFQQPRATAVAVGKWLGAEARRWEAEWRREERERAKLRGRGPVVVGGDWEFWMRKVAEEGKRAREAKAKI